METTTERINGRISAVKADKGYGFIISPEMSFTRIFFHWSALPANKHISEVKKDDKIEFTIERYIDNETKEDKGFRAIKIKFLE